MKKTLTSLSILAILISGCKKNDLAPDNQTSINSGDGEDLKSTAAALVAYRMPDSNHFDSIPQDPKNPLTANKVALGQLLFHESRLGINNLSLLGLQTYSCATCHHA